MSEETSGVYYTENKCIEMQLLKTAISEIIAEKFFEEPDIKNLMWRLKKIFSFEIKINEIGGNTFEFSFIYDGEIRVLTVNIVLNQIETK